MQHVRSAPTIAHQKKRLWGSVRTGPYVRLCFVGMFGDERSQGTDVPLTCHTRVDRSGPRLFGSPHSRTVQERCRGHTQG